jgi:hypothetical protein
MAALNCFTEYMGVCAAHGVQHATLDDCFLGWARWCIDARVLYATPEQQLACVAARTERAGTYFRVRSMLVLSFRTYLNALVFLYKVSDRDGPPIVASSASQFPKCGHLPFCVC